MRFGTYQPLYRCRQCLFIIVTALLLVRALRATTSHASADLYFSRWSTPLPPAHRPPDARRSAHQVKPGKRSSFAGSSYFWDCWQAVKLGLTLHRWFIGGRAPVSSKLGPGFVLALLEACSDTNPCLRMGLISPVLCFNFRRVTSASAIGKIVVFHQNNLQNRNICQYQAIYKTKRKLIKPTTGALWWPSKLHSLPGRTVQHSTQSPVPSKEPYASRQPQRPPADSAPAVNPPCKGRYRPWGEVGAMKFDVISTFCEATC